MSVYILIHCLRTTQCVIICGWSFFIAMRERLFLRCVHRSEWKKLIVKRSILLCHNEIFHSKLFCYRSFCWDEVLSWQPKKGFVLRVHTVCVYRCDNSCLNQYSLLIKCLSAKDFSTLPNAHYCRDRHDEWATQKMLNIICHITASDGKTLRYTVKIQEDSIVQNLVDRIQQRFNNEPLSKVQRNDRVQGPASILFFDEIIESGDEFYFSFEQLKVSYLKSSRNVGPFRRLMMCFQSETPVSSSMDYEVPSFIDQMPQLQLNQPLPPSSEGSPSSQITQQTSNEMRQEVPMLNGNEQQVIMSLTPALAQVTLKNIYCSYIFYISRSPSIVLLEDHQKRNKSWKN